MKLVWHADAMRPDGSLSWQLDYEGTRYIVRVEAYRYLRRWTVYLVLHEGPGKAFTTVIIQRYKTRAKALKHAQRIMDKEILTYLMESVL